MHQHLEITDQQYGRLPKYAQEYVSALRRDLAASEEKARQLTDDQTPTKIWADDYGSDRDQRKHYVQSDEVVVVNAGICLTVRAYRDDEIQLNWSEGEHPFGMGDVALIPTSYQQARLVACQNMRSEHNE